jgi:hypothetical protein
MPGKDVRIGLEVVRMGVVGVVLVDPPAVAESVQQVGVQQAEQRGRHAPPGYLVVAGVMAEEADLRRSPSRSRYLGPGPSL